MDVGVEFGHYRIVEHIGRGGMADVWSARDRRLNRTVAVKTMVRDLSHDLDPVRLFEREAKTIAALEHPHILPIYDFGDYDSQLYIVMRYVSGGSLEDLVDEGALTLEDVLRLARAIAQALEYAHSNNVVHLDLKPSNILMDSNNSPYLADFGLAAVLGPEGRAANPGSGTLLYMAPEQLTSDVLDHRADIYSFSVMLFHMLTGQLPFDATTPLALKQIQFQQGLPELELVSPNLPPALTDVLRMGTALDPAQRPQRVIDLLREFEQVLTTTVAVAMPQGTAISPDLLETQTDLSDMITQPASGPEAQARREAQDIYNRARRAWAYGQGRFLLGVTHYMLISDYYMAADRYGLEVDEAGLQMLLRGALEYDHEIDYWWNKLSDESRRWVALHTVRSESVPARIRAIERLALLPDADVPVIPKTVAQALQNELNEAAQLAALRTLEARARLGGQNMSINVEGKSRTTQVVNRIKSQLELGRPSVWRDVVFSPEIDGLLAETALTAEHPAVAELAARVIGRINSLAAICEIAAKQRAGQKGALRALALVRDEAPSLPPVVSRQARLYAWLANTWRRLSDDSIKTVRRFLLALLGAFLGIGMNTYFTFRSEEIFAPARWKVTVSVGLICAVLVGFLVLLADEFPRRLTGFWPWWARFLLSAGLGLFAGTVVWAGYTYLYLEYPPEPVVVFAGAGLALGFVASAVFHLPGLAAFLLTAVATYVPLYISYEYWLPPVVYYDYPQQIFILGIPLALLIALGGHASSVMASVRRLIRG